MESAHTNEQLCELIKQGRTDLVPQLWSQVESFIKSTANAYVKKYPEEKRDLFEDCVQESYIALPQIVEKFQPDRGGFLTYLKLCLSNVFRAVMFETGRGRRAENDLLNQCISLDAMLKTNDGDEVSREIPDEHAQEGFEAIEGTDYRGTQNAFIRECIQLSCNDTGKAILTEMLDSNCGYREAIGNLYGTELDEDTICKLRRKKDLCVRQIRHNKKVPLIRKKYGLENRADRHGMRGYTLGAFKENRFTSEVEYIVVNYVK